MDDWPLPFSSSLMNRAAAEASEAQKAAAATGPQDPLPSPHDSPSPHDGMMDVESEPMPVMDDGTTTQVKGADPSYSEELRCLGRDDCESNPSLLLSL